MVRTPTSTLMVADRRSASAHTDPQSIPPGSAGRQIACQHGHRRGQLLATDLVAEPLQTQRISDFELVQVVHDDRFAPRGKKTSHGVASFFAHVELHQYARVIVEAHRSLRPSAMVCAAVVPPAGIGYTACKRFSAWLQSDRGAAADGNGTIRATGRPRRRTSLHIGKHGGEMVLDVTDVERLHVGQSA